MLLEVITPDEMLFRGYVKQVVLPGLDGLYGVLDNHAAMISALKEGEVKVEQIVEKNKGKEFEEDEFNGKYNIEFKNEPTFTFKIKGGMSEVRDNKVIVLAE